MLNVHELRKIVWRRRSAAQEYDGYIVVLDDGIRLLGREQATGIDAALTIPWRAISQVRIDEDTIVLDVADGVPILLRPFGGEAALGRLARKLAAALEPPRAHARAG
jgi:hypothetical protein